jgi:hypothetical protein
MDNLRFVEAAYRIQHRHRDGSWAPMEEDTTTRHRSPADHDPERDWSRGRIFRCKSCDESVTIVPGAEGGVPDLP